MCFFFFFCKDVDCTFCFFFFQAEDGIRDYKVTGVQTCALPICGFGPSQLHDFALQFHRLRNLDRKSTRLNSSHLVISYAVFCLKKKKKKTHSARNKKKNNKNNIKKKFTY